MAKIKIHEIAKELGLVSKEVVAKAQELGIEVKNHMSAVTEEQAEQIKNSLKKGESKEAKKESKPSKTSEPEKEKKISTNFIR